MKFFDHALETMQPKAIKELQIGKLRSMFKKIYGHNRFYTDKFDTAGIDHKAIQNVNDMAQIPLTNKEELIKAQHDNPPFGSNATFPESAYSRFHQTSGTTGKPLRVLDTPETVSYTHLTLPTNREV